MGPAESTTPTATSDVRVIGPRIRHERRARRMTLAELGDPAASSPSHLSQIENGHREPTLRLLGALAGALDVPLDELLRPEPPSHRAALELALAEPQREPLYAALDLPPLRTGARAADAGAGAPRRPVRRAAAQVASAWWRHPRRPARRTGRCGRTCGRRTTTSPR